MSCAACRQFAEIDRQQRQRQIVVVACFLQNRLQPIRLRLNAIQNRYIASVVGAVADGVFAFPPSIEARKSAENARFVAAFFVGGRRQIDGQSNRRDRRSATARAVFCNRSGMRTFRFSCWRAKTTIISGKGNNRRKTKSADFWHNPPNACALYSVFVAPILARRARAMKADFLFPPPFGSARGESSELPQALRHAGISRPLLVVDSGLAHTDVFAQAQNALNRRPLSVFRKSAPTPIWIACAPPPEAMRANQADGILAVGGGSAIDAGKAALLSAIKSVHLGF